MVENITEPAEPVKRKPRSRKRIPGDDIITDELAEEIAHASDHYVSIHVMPFNGKWKVKKRGAIRAYGIFAEKRDAMKVAREKRKKFEVGIVFVHDSYGRVLQIIEK